MKNLFFTFLAWATRRYVRRTKPYIIWVTGSVGKTTCRLIIYEMLRKQLPMLRIDTSEKNFNSEIGLCLAILGIRSYEPTVLSTLSTSIIAFLHAFLQPSRADVLVLEYGIDHPWDMDVLLSLATPDISVFTSVDLVHAAYFSSPEDIFTEKAKLIAATRDVAFYGAWLQSRFDDKEHWDILSFALHEDQNDTDIWFNAYVYRRLDESIWSEFIVCEGEDRMTKIRTNLVWYEHAWYLSLAYEIAQIVAVRKDLTFPKDWVLDVTVTLQPWRMSRLLGKWGSLLLDSSYNASPSSMQMMIALITDIRQQLFPDRQLIFCLGDMRELWVVTDEQHKNLAGKVMHADCLFLIGESMQLYLMPELERCGYAAHRVFRFSDAWELWDALHDYLERQQELSLVLFKWSQNTIFLEEAVKKVLRYVHDEQKLCRQSNWWKMKKK